MYEVVEVHSAGPVHALLLATAPLVVVALTAGAVATVRDVQVFCSLEKVNVKDQSLQFGSGAASTAAKRAGRAMKAFIFDFGRGEGIRSELAGFERVCGSWKEASGCVQRGHTRLVL